ncbi:MAG: anthranilate synthase component I family protein [Bacteroidota bacterium]|nr:anthranilate synthase component I family protein [Bacteroidota bacterium]
MKRKFTSYSLADFYQFKNQLLNFGKRFSNFCFLDNHHYDFDKTFECVAGFGVIKSLVASSSNSLQQIDQFKSENTDWIFGHLSYDLKNEIEGLSSKNEDHIGFEDFYFFVPEIVFILSRESVNIGADETISTKDIFEKIVSITASENTFTKAELKSKFSKEEYLATVKKLQQHILRGDCYEICFCQEFFAENIQIDPISAFKKLSEISPNPFSAFYKFSEKYLMCASPERFLKKTNNLIISQPIKGTSKRSTFSDEEEKSLLKSNEKERAENIMIVDLVRNDLSKICVEGSVEVKEFLEIYSFPQVHQMISTIAGKLAENVSLSDIFYATFPMGSMTGAPKKRVLELIEMYEKTKRGLFSGSVGYITPSGDFDFNVVIRSILYNEKSKYLSIPAGSAITWKSDAEKEFEECELKIEGMKKTLE